MTSPPLEFALNYSSAAKCTEYRACGSTSFPVSSLRYNVEDAGSNSSDGKSSQQARFKDKVVFVPALKLKGNFSVKAVIDRMIITLVTENIAVAVKIQLALAKDTGARCYVQDLHVASSYIKWRGTIEAPPEAQNITVPGRVFAILVQEPTPQMLQKIIQLIRDRWGVYGKVRPFLIELALDFHVRNSHDPETRITLREQMVGLLQRHYHGLDRKNDPAQFIDLSKGDARLVHEAQQPDGSLKQQKSFLFPSQGSTKRTLPDTDISKKPVQDRIIRSIWAKLYLDGTLYVGSENENLLYRMQHKISDNRNKKMDKADILPDNKRRARIEVEISGYRRLGENLGLRTLDDMNGFEFRDMRKDHLTLWLPTAPKDLSEQLKMRQELEHRGIYGIEIKKAHEKQLAKGKRNAGARQGKGSTGDRMAWHECNESTGNALDRLNKEWRGFCVGAQVV
jgi:hypothetical protein